MFTLILSSLFFMAAPTEKALSPKKLAAKEIPALGEMMEPSRSVMIIDPKERATDYQKAFEMLSQEKSAGKVYFEIAGGKQITNVIDMKVMPSSTLIVFRFNTPQGIKFQAVEIEDILGIHHL